MSTLDAEISLRWLDAKHCDASGRHYPGIVFPPKDGRWLASVMFEAEPELNSEFRCTGFDDAEQAIRAAVPLRTISFTRLDA